VVQSHGWSGPLGFEDAKKVLKDVTWGDDLVHFNEEFFVMKFEWGTDEGYKSDADVYCRSKHTEMGRLVQVTQKGNRTSTFSYYRPSHEVLGEAMSQRCEVDDLDAPLILRTLDINVYQLKDTVTIPLSKLFPLPPTWDLSDAPPVVPPDTDVI